MNKKRHREVSFLVILISLFFWSALIDPILNLFDLNS